MTRVAALLAAAAAFGAEPPDKVTDRIKQAKVVFEEIMDTRDRAIPQELLERAHCLGIVPAMKRGGFIFGGQYGVGVVFCRGKGNRGWVGPSTVRLEGGSFGLQIGGGETDVVFAVMNENGARKLIRSEFTLGGDAAAMAGPVGRATTAETDALMHAEILSWSRSRGIFAGAVIKGSTLRADHKANEELYRREAHHQEILEGALGVADAARDLQRLLTKYSSEERT